MAARYPLIFLLLLARILTPGFAKELSDTPDFVEDFPNFLRKLLFPDKIFCDSVFIGDVSMDTLTGQQM